MRKKAWGKILYTSALYGKPWIMIQHRFSARFGLVTRPENSEKLYRAERERTVLSLARWAVPALIFGLCVFVYSDLFLSGYTQNVYFRVPVIVLSVVYFILAMTRFRTNPRGARAFFLVILYTLMLMIVGILWNFVRQGLFEAYFLGIQGLIVALFACFAGMIGGGRTYAPLLCIPIILLGSALFLLPAPHSEMLRSLLNPGMLAVGLIVVAEVLERLRRRAFESQQEVELEKKNMERLLKLVLPGPVVEDLVKSGDTPPHLFQSSTIMFTDFKDFTHITRSTQPEILIRELNRVFLEIDSICVQNNIEKIKTIGDAYMCAGGVPLENRTHALDICISALYIRSLMDKLESVGLIPWKIRIGVDSGPVMGGIVGHNRFTYDLWGHAVNVAQRMETASNPGCINISQATYDQVREFFECEPRGTIPIKNVGEVNMFFLHNLKSEFSENDSISPNKRFHDAYRDLAVSKSH